MTKRIQQWFAMLVTAFMLTVSVSAFASENAANTDNERLGESVVKSEMAGFAGADYWREVKDGQSGYTTSKSPDTVC
ncbi:formate dehydrogenase -O gamma subunit [Photobacterium aphoticum]|uniref:Formate dehydrogenase-O gamma subunit n=1 Tax=Photobacterium aphoticum TaxID=754436 RepID=A0A090R7N6_9GAMM|nr:formate dehydrogenase -O gamma subunit [Photobacterium aphoticum]